VQKTACGLGKRCAFPTSAPHDGWMFAWKIMVAVETVSMDGEAICFP